MATTQHYLWASGHFLLIGAALRVLFGTILFQTISPWWFKVAYAGAIGSYAIVCYKSLGTPQPNPAYIRRAIMDENVQYLIMAAFWYYSKPITVALAPYAIFSLFHVLTFFRTTLLPLVLPAGPPQTAGGPPTPHPIAKTLQSWVKKNYDTAMKVVAYTEVVIFVRVLLGALIFRNSLLAPIVFAHFLRQRYFQSAFTREAVGKAGGFIEGHVHGQQNPTITNVYEQAKSLLVRWAGVTAPAPAAAR